MPDIFIIPDASSDIIKTNEPGRSTETPRYTTTTREIVRAKKVYIYIYIYIRGVPEVGIRSALYLVTSSAPLG